MKSFKKLWVVCVVGLLMPQMASAQDPSNPFGDAEKKAAKIEDFERKKVERQTLAEEEGKGPRVDRDSNIDGWEQEKLENLTKALKLMERRVQAGDPDEERYPEYLERLSEMYMKMARYYELRAFERLEQSREMEDAGKKGKAQELLRLKEDDEKEALAYRQKALDGLKRITKEYPRYENTDKAEFYQGFMYAEMGNSDKAKNHYHALVREHPDSKYISEALLGLAEYAYLEEELDLADELYSQVIELDPDSDAAGYATYKKGWVYFNMGEAKSALQQFQNVVKMAEGRESRQSLKREAVKDLVKAYSMWDQASPKKAKKYFKKFAKDAEELNTMLERLARLYGEDGQVEKAITMYNRLIKDNKGQFKVVQYQIEIMLNIETYNDPNMTAQEVRRTVLIFNKARQERWEGISDEKEKEYYDMLEQYARETAKWYHLTAQTTKNPLYYALAYELYATYVDNFPEAQDNFEMMYYYSELLYWKKNWPVAAQRYDQVVEMALAMENPSAEEKTIMMDAAYGAVLSYHKTMGEEPTKECPGIPEPPQPKKGEAPTFPEFEIPECRTKLIASVDRYVKLVPESEELVDIKYTAARIFYDYNHFDESIKRFDDIAFTHSEDRLAMISANLLLDSLKIRKDYKGMWDYVKKFQGNEKLNVPPFQGKLEELEVKLAFKFCNDTEQAEDWIEAAECYEAFAENYPMSEFADRSLWNASVDWENASEIGKAIDARIMLLKEFGDASDLAPDALYAIAQNYHGIAVYSKAAHFYELFSKRYPGKANACSSTECSAQSALSNAAAFRAGLGEYKKAVKDYDLYIERYPKDKQEIAKLKFNTGKIYFDQKEYGDAAERYKEYLDKYAKMGTPGRRVAAYTAIGRSYWRMNAKKYSVNYFEEAEEEFNSRTVKKWLEKGATEEDVTETMNAAAEARFYQGEYIFAKAMEVQLYDEESLKLSESKQERHLQRKLKKKAEIMQEAIPIYTEVIQRFNSPHWGLAALCRLGMMFHDVAKQVENSPVPKRLTEDQKLIYEDILFEFAGKFEEQAVGYYVTAVQTAARLGWFNEYTTLARQRLFDLRPQEYRSASEIKAQPNQALLQWQRSDFYTDVEEAAGRKKKKKRRVVEMSAEEEQKLENDPNMTPEGEEGAPEGGEKQPDATQ